METPDAAKGEPSGSPFAAFKYCFFLFGSAEIPGDSSYELATRCRGCDITLQDGGERYVMTVKGARIACVLVDNSSVQVDTCEKSLAARIGQQFRLHRQVGRCGCVSSHRAGRCRGIAADLELGFQKGLHAAIVDCDQY